jgi:hypothetical protein
MHGLECGVSVTELEGIGTGWRQGRKELIPHFDHGIRRRCHDKIDRIIAYVFHYA